MFLMVSSSCKHVANGCKIEVIETTTECTTGCVAFFMWGGGGGVGEPKQPPENAPVHSLHLHNLNRDLRILRSV